MSEATRWFDQGPLDALEEGRIVAFEVEGEAIALFRTGETVNAFFDACPHRGTPFTQAGRVEDGQLLCMVHYWAFELPSGQQTHVPEICLRRFPTRVVNGQVQIGSLPPPE